MTSVTRTVLAVLAALTTLASTATAEEAPVAAPPPAGTPAPTATPAVVVVTTQTQPVAAAAPAPATVASAQPATPSLTEQTDDGWKQPVGKRFLHGFRLGYLALMNYDRPNREGGMSLKQELGLKTPHMMLLGYEGFYRMVGHSWLNVLLVGNVTVAGLEQSKFIPAASGLIGFEFDRSFQVGVGVNLTPDTQQPSHMIVAGGWTPRVGAIHTPVHFFFVPDTEKNHRVGVTVGVTW